MYVKSVDSKQTAKGLLVILSKQEPSAFVMGYTGATKMIMAKHVFNPIAKLSYFNTGKKMLNAAIAKDNNNVELVFLRYATQVSAPAILGYNDDVEADKMLIFKSLNRKQVLDQELVKTIVAFMKQQKLTYTEKQQLAEIAK
ncbi:hypothetical protein [Pedobacter helvus]|uniref:Uncharacterized protein n=1 Tax=Pedobacter helvus TaxID=2563444 RepID=A0ABW9JF19_9SPHI|nr:hypothetical protein [Pedobacter ureilyticus]